MHCHETFKSPFSVSQQVTKLPQTRTLVLGLLRAIQPRKKNSPGKSKIRRRGIFGFKPGIFRVMQLMIDDNILFSILNRTLQKQFCVCFHQQGFFLFYDKNSISYEWFDSEKGLKMIEFRVNFLKYLFGSISYLLFLRKLPKYFYRL